MKKYALLGAALLFLSACADQVSQTIHSTSIHLEIPSGFPIPEFPEDNPLTAEKVALGKALFFDKSLSSDSTLSCASCHQRHLAFSDGMALSNGVNGKHTDRNAPSLMNVAFHPYFMHDGGPQSLELQILTPLEAENEMNLGIDEACKRLNASPEYKQLFLNAFDTDATPFTLTRAIACYERTLIGGDSKYDRWIVGEHEALDSIEIAGLELFNSQRLGCTNCHTGVLFSNFKFENNGTYQDYPDNGRFRLTVRDRDIGKFKVPSLRNVAFTGPYMFNGSFATLDDVIRHYESGGSNHPNKSEFIKPFTLTDNEREALIAFLYTLTEKPVTD